MSHELSFKDTKAQWHGSLKSYLIGFTLSLLLTCLSFATVYFRWAEPSLLIYVIAGLALIQAIVQVIFFLHVGEEDKPRWESLIFWFMILVMVIVVVGSLWIMHDLNERVMPGMHLGAPTQMTEMPHD